MEQEHFRHRPMGDARHAVNPVSQKAPAAIGPPSRSKEDDLTLLRGAARGDAAAFKVIHDRHFDRLAGFAFQLLGNAEDTGDIVQDAFLALLCKLADLRAEGAAECGVDRLGGLGSEPDGLRRWLLRVVRNKAVDLHRRRRRKPSLTETDATADGESLLSARSAIEREPSPPDEIEALRLCLGLLPQHLRAVVVLLFVEQLRLTEVAEVLARAPGSIGRRRDRAYDELRKCIKRRIGSAS